MIIHNTQMFGSTFTKVEKKGGGVGKKRFLVIVKRV